MLELVVPYAKKLRKIRRVSDQLASLSVNPPDALIELERESAHAITEIVADYLNVSPGKMHEIARAVMQNMRDVY